MVDARPVGYEMNRSVYIVQQIWDDVSVINVFEAAAEMNEHKTYVLVDSMPEVEDAFSQCGSDHEALLPLSPSCLDLLCGCCDPDSSVTTVNPVFFIPIQFVFLDPFLDYPNFLSLKKLCIKVVKETRDSSGKHARDYTLYTGALGTAYLFLL
ncbi:hypothetical protein HN51_019131 [Arachis hypogaea]